MGVRKLLKTSLTLLAIGGVSFSANAFAGQNVLDVIQDSQNGHAEITAPNGGQLNQEGSKNELHVYQKGGETNLKATQKGDNNYVAAETDNTKDDGQNGDAKLEFVSGTSSGEVNTVTITQENNNNQIIGSNTTPSSQVGKVTAGDNLTVTITQKGNDIVKFGEVTAATDASITINQESVNAGYENTVDLSTLKTNSGEIELNFDQQGEHGSITFKNSVEAATDIIAKATQSGEDDNITFDNVEATNGSIWLHDYQGSAGGIATQSGRENSLSVTNVTANNNLDLGLTQDGDYNRVVMENVESTSGDIVVNVKQNASSGNTLSNMNEVNITNSSVGSMDLDVSQDNSGTGVNNDVVNLDNLTVTGAVNGKISQEGNSNTVNLSDIGTNSAVSSLTIKGYSSDTLTQSGDNNTVDIHDILKGGDVTVAVTQTGGNNTYEIKQQSAVGKIDDKAYMENTGSSENKVVIDYQSSANAISNDFYMVGTGNSVHIGNQTSSSGDITNDFDIYGDSNQIAINEQSGSLVQNTIAIGSSSTSNNSNKIAIQKQVADGAIVTNITINGDRNEIGGTDANWNYQADYANAATGLVQDATGVNAENYLEISIGSGADDNTIGLYQKASAAYNSTYANYASITIADGADNNQVYIYQNNSAGGNYVDVDISSSDNIITVKQTVANGTNAYAVVKAYQN